MKAVTSRARGRLNEPPGMWNTGTEVMEVVNNTNLVVLIEGDAEACKYFLSLPEQVRDQMNAQPEGIGSLDDLRARAAQLMPGG